MDTLRCKQDKGKFKLLWCISREIVVKEFKTIFI
jgi:hypothetical protein